MIPFSPLVQSVPSKEVSKASCLPSVAATASHVVATTYLPTYYYSFLCMYDDGLSISLRVVRLISPISKFGKKRLK